MSLLPVELKIGLTQLFELTRKRLDDRPNRTTKSGLVLRQWPIYPIKSQKQADGSF